MPARVVVPEILDSLPPEDPEALRSRRDLRRINFFMGNERWVLRAAGWFREAAGRGIAEIGAGDGFLAAKLARRFPGSTISAFDLAPRPVGLDSRIEWKTGDIFASPPPEPRGMIVANLFLHHFESPELAQLGQWMADAAVLVFSEPDRRLLPHLLGYAAHPFINRVTRNDMHVSIRAGFSAGEIRGLLGLDPGRWRLKERRSWRGGRRVLAWRT